MQLIVLGMHRSGTSSVARLLNMMGAYFSPEDMIMSPQKDNPKGFWERKDVMELNDEILQMAGGTWDHVSGLDFSNFPVEKKRSISHKVQKILSGLDAHRPWFLKDPRMCLTFPLWRNFLEVPIGLIVYRNPIQVARSLEKRNAIPVHVGIALWEHYMVCALKSFQGIPRIIIRYKDVLDSPNEVVGNLFEYLQGKDVLGLRCPSKKEVTSFISRDLSHSKHDVTEHSVLLNQAQLSLIELFNDKSTGTGLESVDVSLGSLDILEAHSGYHDNIISINNELNEAKSSLADARDAQETSLSAVRCELSALEVERNQLQEKLSASNATNNDLDSKLRSMKHSYHTALTEKTQLADRFKELEEQAYALLGVSELLDSHLKILQEEFGRESEKVSQYDSWMREIKRDTQDTFSSFRWKVGDKIASMAEILLLRFNKKTTRDHIAQILGEYEAFIVSGGHPVQVVGSKQDTCETINKWGTFCKLVLAALENPTQTARLLDVDRLKNLYITLFKQAPHVQDNIFDYYLKLYGKNTTYADHAPLVDIDQNNPEITANQSAELLLVENPQVSIIIPVYNQWEYTEKCIRSVLCSAKGLAYEIILADDHSTDKTTNAANIFPGIRVVKTQENSGFLLNCNNAATDARGDYLVFLNNDTVVHENWLQAMLEIMETRPETGMTGSKLIYPDGKLQEAGGIIWDDASGWNYGRLDDPAKPEYNYVKEVDYISGASIMIRRSLWDDIGGFDERYVPAYGEDSDLAFQVRQKGFVVAYTPFSIVTHFEGQSHGTDESKSLKKYQVINKQKFSAKWSSLLQEQQFPNAVNVFQARDRSRDRKTILVIDHYVPHYDQDAGSKTVIQYLRLFVEEGYSVKFIGDNFYQHEPYTAYLQHEGIEVLFGPWYSKNWQQWFKDNAEYIDYVFLNRPHIAKKYIDYVKKYSKAKIVYYGHDLHFLREKRRYEIQKDDSILNDVSLWKKIELGICNKSDVVLYPSAIEIKELKRNDSKINGMVIPAYIYSGIASGRKSFHETNDLMFVGGFGHPPNVDAVVGFISDIFPQILSMHPSIHFYIIGSDPPEIIQNLVTDNITVTGYVTDEKLAEFYNTIRIVVAPLTYGAGVKGKIVESIHHGVPVVTTSIGAEGLPESDSVLKIEDDPVRFAESVLMLYENELEVNKFPAKAESYIRNYFSSESVKKILSTVFQFSA